MAWSRCNGKRGLAKLLNNCIGFQTCCILRASSRFNSGIHEWTSQHVRTTFLDYFKQRHHQYVHSSSILPKKGEGSYFINAGMNQFKPIFLGTAENGSILSSYKTVVNSQKCIRVGGKHNDLEAVGQDTYHHTFFEMLGSWSFGQYFKKEACIMAWDLLTNVYKLPKERLYVSYFAGDDSLGLAPDLECYKIWKELGVNDDHILQCGIQDNFWDMGETGPCGPCTEIHYDHVGNRNATKLVNSGSPEVVELWNLVFMSFDRQKDGSLKPLINHHVDTGMGLERLCAVLQGSDSNYDTDLFKPIFNAIQQRGACAAYTNHYGCDDSNGIDTAYRIVADHIRMVTVAIADGLFPDRNNLDSKLKQVMERCIYQAYEVLKCNPGTVSSLVPLVIHSLGDAFPELKDKEKRIKEVVDQVEKHYSESIKAGSVMFCKALRQYGNIDTLTGEQIWKIQDGHFGRPVPLEIIKDLASSKNISFDNEGYQAILLEYKEKTKRQKRENILSSEILSELQVNEVNPTDDYLKYDYLGSSSGYSFNEVTAVIKGLIQDGHSVQSVDTGSYCGVITDHTGFYSEGGGQIADTGHLDCGHNASMMIDDVQKEHGYVVHFGKVHHGSLSIGDDVKLSVNPEERFSCMCNHTATHILQYALRRFLSNVEQAGSEVTPNKLTFLFRSSKHFGQKKLEKVSLLANEIINQNLSVFREEVPLNIAQGIHSLVTLSDEVYPQVVQVVSIGESVKDLVSVKKDADCSVELCGGTHVHKTGDLGCFVITQVQGVSQGTQKIVAVTGAIAAKALSEGNKIQDEMDMLKEWIQQDKYKEKWLDTATEIQQSLYDITLIPSIIRINIQAELDQLNRKYIGPLRNKRMKQECLETVTAALESASPEDVLLVDIKAKRHKDVESMLAGLGLCPLGPVVLFLSLLDNKKDTYIVYLLFPETVTALFNVTPEKFVQEMCERSLDTDWKESLKPKKLSNVNFIYSFALHGDMEKMLFSEIVKEMYSEYI